MSRPMMEELELPFVESVFHPTDFSESSHLAFAHALAISLIRRTRLDILHAGQTSEDDWSHFPRVRETLVRWGVLAPGSRRSAVFDELSVRVRKVNAEGNPVERSLEFIQQRAPDLVVLATGGRRGLFRWLEPSRALAIARRSRAMTLFVPSGCRSIVSPATGHLSLKRILVPIAASPDASPSLVHATRAASSLGDPPVEIELLHVGGDTLPEVVRPKGEDWNWHERTARGDVVKEIVRAAWTADLVVMPTGGRKRPLGRLRGSITERVVRQVSCPVLSIPADPPSSGGQDPRP